VGGGGHIGSAVVRALLAHPEYRVRVFDISFQRLGDITDQRLSRIKGDLEDFNALKKAITGTDIVCHFAYLRSTEDKFRYVDVNIKGTLKVLEASRLMNVRHVLYASSFVAIGPPKYLQIDEKHPCNPESFKQPSDNPMYGIMKATNEKFCVMYQTLYGLPTTCFRHSHVYSESISALSWKIFEREQYVEKALRGEIIEVPEGAGTEWVHIDDIAQGWTLACLNRKAFGETFFLSGNNSFISHEEMAKMAVEATQSKSKVIAVPIESSKGGFVETYHFDVSKARKLLGYRPKYGKEKASAVIREYIDKKTAH
jgi:nucleoside-diphosphate-sugar epimerase